MEPDNIFSGITKCSIVSRRRRLEALLLSEDATLLKPFKNSSTPANPLMEVKACSHLGNECQERKETKESNHELPSVTCFPPLDEPDWTVSDDNVVARAENVFCALYLFTRLALYRLIRFHLLIIVIVKLTVLILLCCIEGNYSMYSVPVLCAKCT